MLNIYRRGGSALEPVTPGADWRPDPDVIWIDLLEPTREEELAVEAVLEIELPTVAEMEALEPSSRLYQEDGATFMTATLLANSEAAVPTATPVTFALARDLLITVRYADLKAFRIYAERARDAANAGDAVLGLLEAVVERAARVLDGVGDKTEEVSRTIFSPRPPKSFSPILNDLAQAQSVTSFVRNSLVSLTRLIGFAGLASEMSHNDERRAHLVSLQQDTASLTEHASYLSSHISFLLDAALGLINIQQNSIIKFFSVVAVVFMPPTLIASIYGMNFVHMPELKWAAGYPLALLAMVLAAILPVVWFKRRGWL